MRSAATATPCVASSMFLHSKARSEHYAANYPSDGNRISRSSADVTGARFRSRATLARSGTRFTKLTVPCLRRTRLAGESLTEAPGSQSAPGADRGGVQAFEQQRAWIGSSSPTARAEQLPESFEGCASCSVRLDRAAACARTGALRYTQGTPRSAYISTTRSGRPQKHPAIAILLTIQSGSNNVNDTLHCRRTPDTTSVDQPVRVTQN
jgi:hypothetical protein